MLGADLLGPVGGDHEHVAALAGPFLPAGQEAGGEAVGPLAVVEQDEGGPPRLPQGVQQRAQGLHAPDLAVRLGAEPPGVGLAQGLRQVGQGGHDRLRPVVQPGPQAGGDLGIVGGGGDDPRGHAVEELERALGGLVDTLAPQDPRRRPSPQGELVEKAGLAPARLGLDHHDPAPAPARLTEEVVEGGELGGAAHEGGFGQRDTDVVEAGGHRGLGHPPFEGGGDGDQVGADRRRRLVALGGVLGQETPDHVVEGPGHGGSQAAEGGRRLAQVLAEHLADVGPLERGTAGEALEEEHTERVEVGPFVGRRLQQPGRLGGEIAGRPHGLVAHGRVEPGALGQPEVDQDGAPHAAAPASTRGVGGAVHHHVGRLHVEVDDAGVVGDLEGGGHVDAHPQGVGDRQGTGRQPVTEGDALDEGLHEIQDAAFAAGGDEGMDRRSPEATEDGGLVLEAGPGGRRHPVGGHRLHDHGATVVPEVGGEPGVHPAAALQQPIAAEPSGEDQWCLRLPRVHSHPRSGQASGPPPRSHRHAGACT